MASIISSVSSFQDRAADSEAGRSTSNAHLSDSAIQERHSGGQYPPNEHHGETTTTQRLLGGENPKVPRHNPTKVTEKRFKASHTPRRHKLSWYHDWWFWEVVGVVVSLGATAAIIIILTVYDDKPLPTWKYGITLNSMLSILSTISKVRLP